MPRPDRHRAALVAAMRSMLRRRGYRATGLSELLAEAGATNGSLYHHFHGGKEELAREAIREAAADIGTALRHVLDHHDDPAVALQAWVDAQAAGLRHDPRDGCAIAPAALESAAISDDLRRAAAAGFAGWVEVLEEALARTRSPELARRQARAVLSAIEGALLLDRTAGTTEHLEALREAVPGLLEPAAPGAADRPARRARAARRQA